MDHQKYRFHNFFGLETARLAGLYPHQYLNKHVFNNVFGLQTACIAGMCLQQDLYKHSLHSVVGLEAAHLAGLLRHHYFRRPHIKLRFYKIFVNFLNFSNFAASPICLMS